MKMRALGVTKNPSSSIYSHTCSAISIELVLLRKVQVKVQSFRFCATLPLLLPKGLQIKILLVSQQPLKD